MIYPQSVKGYLTIGAVFAENQEHSTGQGQGEEEGV
jgi:hypothetical protein